MTNRYNQYQLIPLGDTALLIRFGERIGEEWTARVRRAEARLAENPFPGFSETVPAYASLAVHYDPVKLCRSREWPPAAGGAGAVLRREEVFETVCRLIRTILDEPEEDPSHAQALQCRTVTIPVCYGGAYGPDLDEIAKRLGMSAERAVSLHAGAEYTVAMVGFAPGFPYLAGLPQELASPRRDAPRLSVPAGSVAIGGAQTGIYSFETPGGWNIIGRTPLPLFRPDRDPPALLEPGVRVRFEPVPPERWEELCRTHRLPREESGNGGPCGSRSGDEAAAGESGIVGGTGGTGGWIRVERPGLLSTVQDEGRRGWQRIGVSVGGAMDAFAAGAANALVANPPEAALIELTLSGFACRFGADALIAVTGGGAVPTIDGRPLPMWRPVFVRAGAVLAFAPAASGCRAYLAAAGGIAVPAVLGSRSTHLAAGFGGLDGRPLRSGDVLPLGAPSPLAAALAPALARQAGGRSWAAADWGASAYALPDYREHPAVRVTAGPEYERFTPQSQSLFRETPFAVSPRSNRMGYRLEGARLESASAADSLSEPVAAGTVQVPPDGQPVVLMADRQTTGGYPRIAQVACADLPILAQLRPGAKIRFEFVTLAESQQLLIKQRTDLGLMRAGIAQKLGSLASR